jgi:Mce-associated membrane protein
MRISMRAVAGAPSLLDPPPLRTLLAALAGLVVLVAAVGGLLWWLAATDPDVQLARTREVVLDAGSSALVELNTIAPDDAAAGLDRWERGATGPLLEQLRGQREQNLAAVRDAGTSTSARLLQAAVTEVDVERGTARMIAALEVTVRAADGGPASKRARLDAELARTPEGWKVAEVEAVGISAGQVR